MKVIRLTFFILIVFGNFVLGQKLKLAYVNSQDILENFPEAVKIQNQLKTIADSWYSKIDSMDNELSKEYQLLKNQFNLMPEEKQQEAANQLKNKQQIIDKFKFEKFNQNNGEFYLKQNELLAPIRNKVFEAIQKVAMTENINYVFDKNVDVFVLYADSTLNITEKVLVILKKQ